MTKKKTTKKEEMVETTTTLESPIEPQVSMEDFTMIEKYQQNKNQKL